MKSRRTQRFMDLLRGLPPEVREQAYKAYRQFQQDPYHPGLQFKRVSNTDPLYSARIGSHYRVLGRREAGDEIVWFWIGTHADYDKLLR